MDPNANIARQRELVREIQKLDAIAQQDGLTPETADDTMVAACELAELVQALDGWLCRGGFRPSGWDALARSQARMGGVRGD